MSHYTVLEVPTHATDEEIRKAYIKLSLKYHPDRNQDPDATDKFQQIAEAYFVLSDPKRRREYNAKQYEMPTDKVDASSLFGSVFEDLYRPEVDNPTSLWSNIGTLAGAALGFIIFNVPGAVGGAILGNRAGKVRDNKGVCVYEAFQNLELGQRQQILANIASRVFEAGLGSAFIGQTTS